MNKCKLLQELKKATKLNHFNNTVFSLFLFVSLFYYYNWPSRLSQVVSCFCYLQKHTQSPAAQPSLPPFLRIPRPGSIPPGGPRSPRFGGPPRSPFRPGIMRGRPPFPFRPGMPPPGGSYRGASPPPGMVRKTSLESNPESNPLFAKVPPSRRSSQQALPPLGEQAYTPPSLHSESPTAPLAPAYPGNPMGDPMRDSMGDPMGDPMGNPEPYQLQQQGCTTDFDHCGQISGMDHADLDADPLEWSQSRMPPGGYCDSPGTASLASTTNLDNTDNYPTNNLRQSNVSSTPF